MLKSQNILRFWIGLFSCIALVSVVYAAQYYRVNNGQTVLVNEHWVQYNVTNSCGAWKDIFVPTNSPTEWSNFRTNKPGCISLTNPAVNCVGSWSNNSTCSATCGGWVLQQVYTITTAAANGWTACPAANWATQWGSTSCNTQGCPVNCVGSWSNNSTCSATCGGWVFQQVYTITTAAANGGTACSATNGATRWGSTSCNTQGCPVNCVGSWYNDDTCSASCGGWVYLQIYSISTPAANWGTSCAYANGATRWGSTSCNTYSCPVNCTFSSYWSGCNTTCGAGTKYQYYTITSPEMYGWTCAVTEWQYTGTSGACTNTSSVGTGWSAWSACSATCGWGTQTRTDACGNVWSQACNTQACPVNWACSTTIYACNAGTPFDEWEDCINTRTSYTWSCVWSGGGTTANCIRNLGIGSCGCEPEPCAYDEAWCECSCIPDYMVCRT